MSAKHCPKISVAEPLFNKVHLAVLINFLRKTNFNYDKTLCLDDTQSSSTDSESEIESLNPTIKTL